MRRVDRAKVSDPPILHKSRPSDGKTELQLVTEHMAGPDREKPFDFARYKEPSVKSALDQLFFGKCAYCESSFGNVHPVDVEHYRPKGEVEGVIGHPGYWWLAMDWRNLLPSCIDCNRRRKQKTPKANVAGGVSLLASGQFDTSKSILTGKDSIFPVLGAARAATPADDLSAEQRLLLDPTRDHPDDHLVFHVDRSHLVSVVYPKPLDPAQAMALPDVEIDHTGLAAAASASGVSAMGMVSIQVYGLNRLGLVQARTKIMRDLEFLLDLSESLEEIAIELESRVETQTVELTTSPANRRLRLEKNISIDKKIAGSIRQFIEKSQAELRALTQAQAPYSRLALAWVQAYLAT